MKKQMLLLGVLTTLAVSWLLVSGCTQQNILPQSEDLHTILEKAAILETVSYELDITTRIDESTEQVTTIKIWQKTPYLMEEVNSTSGGITTNLTIIKRPDGIYRYDTVFGAYQLDLQTILPQPSTLEWVTDLLDNQTLTILGTESINGTMTTVLEYTPIQAGNSTTIKMWIWNDKGVPLKAQSITRNEELTVTINYTFRNYSFSDIAESIFNIE